LSLTKVSTEQDQARSIAERVARRVKNSEAGKSVGSSQTSSKNGSPVREELSAIRLGLHDLENKLDRIESKIVQGVNDAPQHRARLIDFVSSSPPVRASAAIASAPKRVETRDDKINPEAQPREFVPATESPWLRNFGNNTIDHPSQERFGVEEATVAELVEFFENEKKCSIDPSGQPCDHCAMCSSRGF